MPYEHKPGQFTLFKNDKKEKDTHADYKGDGLDLDGKPVWVNAWLKGGANGKPRFLSCAFKHKDAAQAKQGAAVDEDDIGF